MSEIVLRFPQAKGMELVFDDADVSSFASPREVETISCAEYGCGGCGCVHRRTGQAHLILDFAEGKVPLWRERDGSGDGAQ